jgi:hypothetical protein
MMSRRSDGRFDPAAFGIGIFISVANECYYQLVPREHPLSVLRSLTTHVVNAVSLNATHSPLNIAANAGKPLFPCDILRVGDELTFFFRSSNSTDYFETAVIVATNLRVDVILPAPFAGRCLRGRQAHDLSMQYAGVRFVGVFDPVSDFDLYRRVRFPTARNFSVGQGGSVDAWIDLSTFAAVAACRATSWTIRGSGSLQGVIRESKFVVADWDTLECRVFRLPIEKARRVITFRASVTS